MSTKRKVKRVIWKICIVVIVLLAGAAVYWLFLSHKPVSLLPTSIHKQTSFVVYLPDTSWQTPQSDMSYANNVLTLHASSADGTLTITEQATPEVFNDVPQYYPNLITKLNKYTSFGTVNGVVYLTKPKELNGQQQAVLNNNGTLLFVHPSSNLSDDTWRRFFNNLVTVKPGE